MSSAAALAVLELGEHPLVEPLPEILMTVTGIDFILKAELVLTHEIQNKIVRCLIFSRVP